MSLRTLSCSVPLLLGVLALAAGDARALPELPPPPPTSPSSTPPTNSTPETPAPIPAPTASGTSTIIVEPPPPPPKAPPPPVEKHWYGLETLFVDAAALGLIGVGLNQTHGGASWSVDCTSNHGNCRPWPYYTALGVRWAFHATRGADTDPWPLDVGLALYTFGAPIVHLLHGNYVPALASGATRAGGPSLGLAVGAVVGGFVGFFAWILVPCGSTGCHGDIGNTDALDTVFYTGFYLGAIAGMLGPVVVDAVALAKEPIAPAAPAEPAKASLVQSLTPRLGLAPGRTTVGLGGTF